MTEGADEAGELFLETTFQVLHGEVTSRFDDIVSRVIEDLGPNILKAAYVSVNGAEYPSLVFEIDRAKLWSGICPALRAAGLIPADWQVGHSPRS
jgi:hypothetical protein